MMIPCPDDLVNHLAVFKSKTEKAEARQVYFAISPHPTSTKVTQDFSIVQLKILYNQSFSNP